MKINSIANKTIAIKNMIIMDKSNFTESVRKELKLVEEFHTKFKAPIAKKPTLIKNERSALRYKLMNDEVIEYKVGCDNNDLENIAKELADILYATYGTIIEHGLQDKMNDIFIEVHKSNMSKDYHELKMIKGKRYFEANIRGILNE